MIIVLQLNILTILVYTQAGSLNALMTLKAVRFDAKSIFIFLKVTLTFTHTHTHASVQSKADIPIPSGS